MSDTFDWNEVAEVFADIVEQPRDRQRSILDARCAGRADVRSAVERLLEADATAEPEFLSGLDPVWFEAVARAIDAPLERAGPYRFIRELGRGGMGQVFLAERADGEFEQRVAIKVLKRGMDSDSIRARFLRERQILARLEHPNIARVFDGGITQDGRPYFVMEHVDGQPITEWCDERRLTIDERLELFETVCRAVEHAHHNLVVHRDLKPSNILVTRDGRAKLLDFGIAKLLAAGEEAAAATLTNAGTRVLTPEYAAPEQLTGASVGTSTDVYGLGAVLYELLAGRRPFPRAASIEEHIRRALDRKPQLLSASVSEPSGAASPDDTFTPEVLATRRGADPARLRRRLAGDLDTIVATALRAEPERRYVSVEALRGDIRYHRERRPVTARRDTRRYRVSQFISRHRIGVLVTAIVTAFVVAFVATAGLQANRIRLQAADLEVERDRARGEAAVAQQVSDFLIGVFEVSDPMVEGRGDSIRARDLLERGAEHVETELGDQPALQARMLTVIGRAFDNLTLSERAEPLVRRALELERANTGDESAAVIAGLQQLARIQHNRGRYDEAEPTLQEAISTQERLDPNDPMMWQLLADLADTYHGMGDPARAATATTRALDLIGRIPPAELSESRDALERMARLLGYAQQWEDEDAVRARLVEVERAAHGPRSAPVAEAYRQWAATQEWRGNIESADSLFGIALGLYRELAPRSTATAQVLSQMGSLALTRDAVERADSMYRASLDIYVERLGETHSRVAVVRMLLADTQKRRGRPDEAIQLYELAIASFRRAPGSPHVLLPVSEWRLASALHEAGQLGESLTAFRSALQLLEERYPPDYALTLNLRCEFASALTADGRSAEAESVIRPALAILAQRSDETRPHRDGPEHGSGKGATACPSPTP